MKKAISILICLLFVLTILYPAGVIATARTEYTFRLISISGFAIALAALSACTVILDLIYKSPITNKFARILLAIIPPLSLINAVFYIVGCPRIWVAASILLYFCCCCYLAVKHGKPLLLKIITFVLSALMILPIYYLSFLVLLFGNLAENTVVKTLESPSGEYCAQVIDSDQGVLGGNTLVDVYEKSGVNLILFKIEKDPQRVYTGDWREFNNLQIHWKDDHCLVINSVEYEID